MKIMKNIGKYMVATLMLVGISACSNDSDGLLSSESVEVSRNAELVTKTIDLGTTPGQLQAKLEAEMSDVSTLQKLTLKGEFNEADVNYWLNNLKNLVEFDLSGATPKHSTTGDTYSGSGAGNGFSGFSFSDNTIGAFFFLALDKLEKVTFPANITSIGDKAFLGCTSLASIEIPTTVTSIGSYAFESCNLTSVTIPSSVTTLGGSMFAGNPNLKSADLSAITNLTSIPYRMFYDCGKLETVSFPSSVERIENTAFAYCKSLKDYTPFLNVKYIEWRAFAFSGLESVDLTNVISMDSYDSFCGCESLTTVILPPAMTTLNGSHFGGCSSLTNITWPTALETIGSSAFSGCGLTEIEIPSTVTTIGYGAFESSKLKTLTIPATVTEVDGSLINYCSDLKALIWNSADLEIEDTYGVSDDCLLYLPSTDYVPGSNWKNIIVNGEAETLELCTDGYRTDGSRSFFVPVAFTAKKISYSRNFNNTTYPGVSSGWQTIVLPFTPTKIEHESKGVVAPFNSEVADAKPFWLRELTADGFVDKTTIEPNKAYIIAMPNHSDYVEEYRLNGKITFSAENVELAATPETLTASDGPTFSLQPTYQKVDRGLTAYTLNTDYWIDGYEYGSVFVRNISDTYAFEAYVTTAGRSARSVFEMDTKSKATTRVPYRPNTTGIPQVGDM